MGIKILVCTAKYSDNLGDGVIADCVEFLIKKIDSNIHITSLDISGRQSYLIDSSEKPSFTKRVFFITPSLLRPFITLMGWFIVFRPRLKRGIAKLNLKEFDLLIFGGGQLINDIALNFPLKVSYIASKAQTQNVKYSFNAIGVGQRSSWLGKKLFERVFKSPHLVGLYTRDNESQKRFVSLFDSSVKPNLTYDCGLWASECYKVKVAKNIENKRIGIGVSHPKELAAHVLTENDTTNDLLFWVSLCRDLLASGFEPVLFSNGSKDDHNFMVAVSRELEISSLSDKIQIIPRFYHPAELVKVISSFSGVISHRLHAHIVAHSLEIPSVSLKWDSKVQSYFTAIERADYCLSIKTPTNQIIEYLKRAIDMGLDIKLIEQFKCYSLDVLRKQVEQI